MDQSVNIDIDDFSAILPLEVLVHLMEFLSYSDRVVASQVCQLWYEACLHPKFTSQEKMVIKSQIMTSKAIDTFNNSSRSYSHIMMIEIDVNFKVQDFLLKMAPNLKSLYFVRCGLHEKPLVDLLLSSSALESLVLEDCRELFMPGRLLEDPKDITNLTHTLCCLKDLNLSSNRYLSDALLNRLLAASPNISAVSLEGCQISYHAGLYKKYYPEKLITENPDYASETVLTFWNLFKIFSKRSHLIKYINLSRTLVDSTSLTKLAELHGLNLEELHLRGCEQLTNAAIKSLAEHQKSLTLLDVSYCSRVTDQGLIQICNNLTNLKVLCVRNCRAITDLGIAELKSLANLEELDISQCEVKENGFEKGLCSSPNKSLKKLFMEGLNTIGPNIVIKLAKNLPSLTHLNLSYCFNAVTDDSVQGIFQHLTMLRSLKLAHCDLVTDAGLTGMGVGDKAERADSPVKMEQIVQELCEPTRLKISLRSRAEEDIIRDANRKKAVQKMCEEQLLQSCNIGCSISHLRGLQELDLRSCNKITDVTLKYSLRFLELQHLNLSQCQQITHVGLEAIGNNNPSIDSLDLSQCYNITDEGIAAVTTSLHRLKYLKIKGCKQLTEAAVDSVAKNCHQLRYLDATHCNGMTRRIQELRDKLPIQTFFSQADDEYLGPVPPPQPLTRL